MTVYDFITMCTQDWIEVDLYDCDSGDCITVNIDEAGEYEDIMSAEMMSWDIEDGRICINYVKEEDC